jgi:hypothetical protein
MRPWWRANAGSNAANAALTRESVPASAPHQLAVAGDIDTENGSQFAHRTVPVSWVLAAKARVFPSSSASHSGIGDKRAKLRTVFGATGNRRLQTTAQKAADCLNVSRLLLLI